jgi:hypothetical protein
VENVKEIVIEIDDDIFRDIKNETGLKIMMGNAYGACDEFLILFIKSVEAGTPKIHVIKRQKGHRKTKI